jgi:hypothetical protein
MWFKEGIAVFLRYLCLEEVRYFNMNVFKSEDQ